MPPRPDTALRGLPIRPPYVDWILSGKKTWEMRTRRTHLRGRIALIKSGSGTVVGTCDLVDCRGPLSLKELRANARKMNRRPNEIERDDAGVFAWVLANVRRLRTPVKYRHPQGAIIWIRLSPAVSRRVGR